jgi:hypothetical protein
MRLAIIDTRPPTLRTIPRRTSLMENASGQREGNIGSRYWRTRCGMSRKVVHVRGRLRRGTEHNIFTPIDLIYGRHSLDRGSHIGFPECLVCCGVEGADFAIARSREYQAATVTTGPTFGKCEPVFLNPFAANSGTSPMFTCHLMVPCLRL